MISRLLLLLLLPVALQAAETDLAHALTLGKRTEGKIFGDRVEVHFPTEGDLAWFKVNGAKEEELYSLDLTTGAKQAISKDKVPQWKPKVLGPVEASRSQGNGETTTISFKNDTSGVVRLFWLNFSGKAVPYGEVASGREASFSTFAGHAWLVKDAGEKPLGVYLAGPNPSLAIISPGSNVADSAKPAPRGIPAWRILLRDHNVFARLESGGEEFALTRDGTPQSPYSGPVVWNTAGTHMTLFHTETVTERLVDHVESSPKEGLQPRHTTQPYAKPGDPIAHPRVCLFDLKAGKQIPVSDALFPTPWSLNHLEAGADGQTFRLLYNQRGHQVLRLLELNIEGTVRTLVEECPRTFVDYTNKVWQHFLPGDKAFLWMSERDGYNHLYRVNTASGQITPITTGAWMVRRVDRVDDTAQQIWFTAMGVHPGQDPYYQHCCRINFDGSGLTILTEGDGTHVWDFSPDGRYLVDRWSRVDQPTVTELRSVRDGKLIAELARGNWDRLKETGWQPPERFVAKGRDGKSDIYGIICRPTNFDPSKKYPVVEKIYAGPHDFFVPKNFRLLTHDREIGEVGFILVQIDGMGTNWRGKAFHDVCWKNLGDSGFPDRIAWMRAAARQHPEMDLSRVGIYGGSAGGQSALRALIDHGDLYRAAVADCGCHDNRMDKIWWNEQWMGWPVDKAYEDSSNVVQAHRMQGHLLLTWGELDSNVDPSSSMQVVNALIQEDKDFDMLIVPGAGHGIGESPYLHRRRMAFFQRWLGGPS